MNRSDMTKAVVQGASKHPYLWAAVICLVINPFFLGAEENIPNNALWLESILVLGAVVIFALWKYRRGDMDKLRLGVFLGCAAVADLVAVKQYSKAENKALWHFAGGFVILLILYYFADTKKYREQVNSLMIIGMGFCLKIHYILVTSVYTRQHDVHSFGGDSGHAAYMEYLLFNHSLPDFDLRERWQFCHPPLHHTISALWIHLNENILNVGHNPARESLQTLTLFYTMCIIISAYKIMKYFGLKDRTLYIPLIIVSVHPSFTLFSGSINNDVLSVALAMGAVVGTLEWYREPTLKKIMPIAVCIGCAMMTKVSAALIAPPVALVFLIVFVKNFKAQGKNLFMQFVCFGLVCIPLGLWFGIRSYIKWKIPLTYVNEMSPTALQYIGDQPFKDRVTDFSAFQLASPYEQWAYRDDNDIICGYNEYNPLITLMKNSMFGEYINENNFSSSFINTAAVVLFWVNVVIAVIALVAMIVVCVKRFGVDKLFLASFYAIMMVSFYKTAADYPYTCTMNYRYITPTAITGAVFIGLVLDGLPERRKWGDTAVKAVGGLVLVFAAAVYFVYLGL